MLIRPEGGPDGAMSLVLRRVDLKHIKLVGRSNKQFLAFTKDFVREDAVGKIAKFWRRYGWTMKMKDLAGAYRTVKLTELDARGMGFEFIVQYLRKSFVLKVSLLFYRRILYGAADIAKIRLHDLSEHEEKPNIRVFLCGYMIVYYGEQVFEEIQEKERRLVHAATALLRCVHEISDQLVEGVHFKNLPTNLVETLPTLHAEFVGAFNAWKVPDLKVLVERIVYAVQRLFAAFCHLSTYHPNDEPLRAEFRLQIRRLRAKLDEIKGPGTSSMVDQFITGSLVYETWDPLDPIDWPLWANFHMDELIAAMDEEYWEARATLYMSVRLDM